MPDIIFEMLRHADAAIFMILMPLMRMPMLFLPLPPPPADFPRHDAAATSR